MTQTAMERGIIRKANRKGWTMSDNDEAESLLIEMERSGDGWYGRVQPVIARQRATIQQQAERITDLEDYEKIADWFSALVVRAAIGTKETPSLKAYIEQLEARVKQLLEEVTHWRESAKECGAVDGHSLALNFEELEAQVKALEIDGEEYRQYAMDEVRVKEVEALYADSCSALNAHMDIHAQVVNRVKELEAIAPPCRWYQDGDGEDRWMTACGRIFCLNEGTPSDNKMSWCCYCGGKLEEHLDTAPDSA